MDPFNQEKVVPGFTVHYNKGSKLQEAMEATIPDTQVITHEVDCQFLEQPDPTFKVYLNEHFYI